ncbi:hypothetical protein PISMIDRAFT_13949 [Pisolithus microcarpus 441]|uniref:Uncharacterized protein n=1 Tax=Pisolithus microcarpus 441 TaxID=765257 RepID=A0A0C9Y2X9_9AGAM|nr:hypothetical protein BKA83DRAFT_13949 [Pisolithus microcarpus]KIK19055.1 hypothetical protein PISMIDRAFT_13949 [Pisolithus microcarpus 441]
MLQALVNLKHPTLHLVPSLAISPDDDPSHTESHDHYALEFKYVCDAPKCPVYESMALGTFQNRTKPSTSAQAAASISPSPAETTESSSSDSNHADRPKKRLLAFQFHKCATGRSASGPALAVVDADHTVLPENENGREKCANEDIKDGARVTIRLLALDADRIGTAVTNEQITYMLFVWVLHRHLF